MKILRVRLDAELGEGLDRLKTERHVNLSAWVRSLIRPALGRATGEGSRTGGDAPAVRSRVSPPAPAPEPETDPRPIPGWSPSKLEDGSWGARFKGDTRRFPDNLVGQVIEVTTMGGDSWTATVVEVIHWGNKSVQVRHSGKPG